MTRSSDYVWPYRKLGKLTTSNRYIGLRLFDFAEIMTMNASRKLKMQIVVPNFYYLSLVITFYSVDVPLENRVKLPVPLHPKYGKYKLRRNTQFRDKSENGEKNRSRIQLGTILLVGYTSKQSWCQWVGLYTQF